MTTDELLDHFLNMRLEELRYVSTNDLGTILGELDDSFLRLKRHRALRIDPHRPYQHLREWAEALRPFA